MLEYVYAAAYLLLVSPISILSFMLSPLLHLLWLATDRILWWFMGRHFIYNVSWEDPRIDHRVLNLGEKDNILTLCSGGDNALDYLLSGAKVSAVDLNSCQIALAELKAVGVQCLDWEVYFKIFGEMDMDLLRELYPTVLRPKLTPLAQEFWDSYVKKVTNLMYAGSSGKFAFFLFRVLFPLFGLGWIRNALVRGVSREEFKAEAEKNRLRLRWISWVGETLLMKSCCSFIGVPKSQLALGFHRDDNVARIVEGVLLGSDMANDNYFYYGYVVGRYTKTNCPRYLQKEHFYTLRKHLNAGNLTLYHGRLETFLEHEKHDKYTVASLLDHMDWMTPEIVTAEMSLLLKHMHTTNGRLFWRSFADTVHSPPLQWLGPKRVDDSGDRVCMYFSTWVAKLADSPYTLAARNPELSDAYTHTLLGDLVTGFKMVAFPIKHAAATLFESLKGGKTAKSHQSIMEAFYRYQKEGYDSFREGLLHGRPILMNELPVLKEEKMVWVDVGGGTARNLEFFPPEVVKKHFKAIYIADISPSLLSIAKDRVNRMGLQSIVKLVECDFTADTKVDLPAPGTADLVTMSYSLSMIPDKKAAVDRAVKLLKPKGEGVFGLTDFFLESKSDLNSKRPKYKTLVRKFEATLHRLWFAQDNVHLLPRQTLNLVTDKLQVVSEQRVRGAVPFMPFFRPVHGVLVCKSK